MKKITLTLHLAFIITTAIFQNTYALNKTGQHLDRIVAVVNESVITHTELEKHISTVKKQLEANHVATPTNEVLTKQVLEQLINKKLQLQFAEQSGITITDNDVQKAIASIAQNNKLSTEELYRKVAEQGINKTAYHKEIQEELILHRVQQQNIGDKITVTPQEVKAFMLSKSWQAYQTKEYHLEDILIALPATPSPKDVAAAKKRAQETLAKIQRGMSFQEAAVAESGENNALQGGDLGWRQLPEIPSAFANELVNMKANDILGPIQTPNGFHLIKLAGVRSVGKQPNQAELREQVQQLLFQRKYEENLQNWVKRVRAGAFVKIHEA